MRIVVATTLLALIAGPALSAETCIAGADAQKLSGAARTSSIVKCQRDATETCDIQAGQKKLYGGAKTSFTGKCVRDAVGS